MSDVTISLAREGALWTNDEILRLGELVRGVTKPDFAGLEHAFGRSAKALKMAFALNGLPNPNAKPRKCLREGCGRVFFSSGPGHRRCRRCEYRKLECA
jgi:hypothetical protein